MREFDLPREKHETIELTDKELLDRYKLVHRPKEKYEKVKDEVEKGNNAEDKSKSPKSKHKKVPSSLHSSTVETV